MCIPTGSLTARSAPRGSASGRAELVYWRQGSDTLTGLAVGGGTKVDWGNLIFFGEYLYTDSARATLWSIARRAGRYRWHVARFGIKYKIGHDFYCQVGVRPLK
jgi:opacity protein-like surface antigen